MNYYEQVEKYECLLQWEEAEREYKKILLLVDNSENIYYCLGKVQERMKKYDKAITSYTMDTFKSKLNSSTTYYRLGYLYDKGFLYKEACSSFLMMKKKLLTIKKYRYNQENRILLNQYIQKLDLKKIENWRKVGEKAESLNIWNVAEYAYKNHIDRNDEFEEDIYFKLGYVLVQQQRYKEASSFFKEQKIKQSIDNLYTTSYNEYYHDLLIEDNIILYDDTSYNYNFLYKLFLRLDNNVHFDTYKHIWVAKDKENIDEELKQHSRIIFITRDSDLHQRYLAKAKYCFLSKETLAYFKLKEKQILLDSSKQKMDLDKYIQEVFFYTIDSHILVDERILDESLYITREKELMYLLKYKNEPIENNLIYFHHKFDAENFAGVMYLLDKAIQKSKNNTILWKSVTENFLPILSDIKGVNHSLWTSFKGELFIKKIIVLEESFNNNLEADLLPYQVWFLFANLFIFSKSYKAYHLARTKARESILRVKVIPNIPFARYRINALLEAKKETEYRELRDKLLENKSIYIQKYLQLLGNSEYYFLNSKQDNSFYESFFTVEEKNFSKYIENKSIAIVGPLQSGLNSGLEIDSYDVVIRFNYNGLDQIPKEQFGEKTNVSFYIAEILLKDKFEPKKVEYMNQLDWIIMDSSHSEEDICFLGIDKPIRKRYAAGHAFATTMLKGAPSGIQRVIMDILRFKIRKIKVFNTNLFLENNYLKTYRTRGKLGVDHFNFFWHDPISNFIFLKRLKENNIIDTDDVLSAILEMSEAEYIDALEVRYGNKR